MELDLADHRADRHRLVGRRGGRRRELCRAAAAGAGGRLAGARGAAGLVPGVSDRRACANYSGLLVGALCQRTRRRLALVTLICRWTRTKEDAAIGIVLSTFFGLGIVLSSIIQRCRNRRRQGRPGTLHLGQAAGIGRAMMLLLIAVVSLVAAGHRACCSTRSSSFSASTRTSRRRKAGRRWAGSDDDGRAGRSWRWSACRPSAWC